MEREVIAAVRDLSVHFHFSSLFKKKVLKAVHAVSLDIYKGEILALVGESGSGKSTLGRAILRLNTPASGNIFFEQTPITHFTKKEMQPLRKEMQMIFQDPNSSLNPRMKLMESVREPLYVNHYGTKQQQDELIEAMFQKVQLPLDSLQKYPHEISGGQKQRVAIARALVTEPKLLIADEPVSALDVSVQAQIINLLLDLKEELALTVLMISHDLSVVEYIADRVAVMYLGNIVEIGRVEDIYSNPQHPYTKVLLEAMPEMNPERRLQKPLLEGDIPSPFDTPSGCPFRTRCPFALEACASVTPTLQAVTAAHQVACLLATKEAYK